jgi:hypothetical protein
MQGTINPNPVYSDSFLQIDFVILPITLSKMYWFNGAIWESRLSNRSHIIFTQLQFPLPLILTFTARQGMTRDATIAPRKNLYSDWPWPPTIKCQTETIQKTAIPKRKK